MLVVLVFLLCIFAVEIKLNTIRRNGDNFAKVRDASKGLQYSNYDGIGE